MRSTSQKKVRWALCPARGALAMRGEALGSRPECFRDGIGIGYPAVAGQKVTGVTNRAMFGGEYPIIHIKIRNCLIINY